jgi:DNA-directed RNA polymerase beta subunit
VYIKHNSLGDDIPIVVVLKAMGLECDEEIVQLVGTEPEIVDLFSGSLEEPYYLGIYSQDQVGHSYGHRHSQSKCCCGVNCIKPCLLCDTPVACFRLDCVQLC